jgi:hypothetical protein
MGVLAQRKGRVSGISDHPTLGSFHIQRGHGLWLGYNWRSVRSRGFPTFRPLGHLAKLEGVSGYCWEADPRYLLFRGTLKCLNPL